VSGFAAQPTPTVSPPGPDDVATLLAEPVLEPAVDDFVLEVAPVAVDDAYMTGAGDVLGPDVVLQNDMYGAGASVEVVALPAAGELWMDAASGQFTYTPFEGVVGVDAFTYRIVQHQLVSNVATVTIEVVASGTVVVQGALCEAGEGLAGQDVVSVGSADVPVGCRAASDGELGLGLLGDGNGTGRQQDSGADGRVVFDHVWADYSYFVVFWENGVVGVSSPSFALGADETVEVLAVRYVPLQAMEDDEDEAGGGDDGGDAQDGGQDGDGGEVVVALPNTGAGHRSSSGGAIALAVAAVLGTLGALARRRVAV
jgi:hypothetical protein